MAFIRRKPVVKSAKSNDPDQPNNIATASADNNAHNASDMNTRKRVAIIGSGVSGLTCAHYLAKLHEVTIFEANDYIGGHVNTIDVTLQHFKK